MSADSFYVFLPSNSSMKMFGNTISHFTTQLRESCTLTGDWEVALTTIDFPQTFLNVLPGQNMISLSYPVIEHGIESIIVDTVYVEPGFYIDGNALMIGVNKALSPINIGKLQLNTDNRYMMVNDMSQDTYVINFSPELSRQLGYEPGTDVSAHPMSIHPLNVGFGSPHHIFVYCDLIESQVVGDTVAPLLRIVNTQHRKYEFGDQITQEFRTLQYLPLLKRNFSTIEIDLRGSTGNPIPFQSGTSAVTLHFRRISASA